MKRLGWAASVVALAVLVVLGFSLYRFSKSRDQESRYTDLLEARRVGDLERARAGLSYFNSRNLSDYRDLARIRQGVMVDGLKQNLAALPATDLPGRCALVARLETLAPLDPDLEEDRRACAALTAQREREAAAAADLPRHKARTRYARLEDAAQERDRCAGWYRTKENYLMATSAAILDRVLAIAASGDREAVERYLRDQYPDLLPCAGGILVYLERRGKKGLVRVRPRGELVSRWMVSEALEEACP